MTRSPFTVFIGLGSNLSNPVEQIKQACASLKRLAEGNLIKRSSLYKSKAIGPTQPDYINAVVEFSTYLSPLELLTACQEIENQQMRVRQERWGPRTIDLDILLIDQECINLDKLTVPHREIEHRNFVLAPLAEIAPELKLPNGSSVLTLAKSVGNHDLLKLSDDAAKALSRAWAIEAQSESP